MPGNSERSRVAVLVEIAVEQTKRVVMVRGSLTGAICVQWREVCGNTKVSTGRPLTVVSVVVRVRQGKPGPLTGRARNAQASKVNPHNWSCSQWRTNRALTAMKRSVVNELEHQVRRTKEQVSTS